MGFTTRALRRRDLLRSCLALTGGASVAAVASCVQPALRGPAAAPMHDHASMSAQSTSAPTVFEPGSFAGFDPARYLEAFDYGRVSRLPDGRVLREYELTMENRDVEIARGVTVPVWTFNGQVPGPTLRANAGDHLRITFTNEGDHLHGVHFHGVHPSEMDGAMSSVAPKGTFVYEFDAEPFGLHLYHCHTSPLPKHIARGLHGAFVIDPPGGRPPVDRELVMVQHGWDVNGDGKNELYAVNGPAFFYNERPIRLRVGERVRIYLANVLEFDPINSFHLHANLFNYFPTGTSLVPNELTDTVVQGQGQRGILEFSYRYPGQYMFHAHKTEFAELGWTGMFDVVA
jgi:FtsP/CotA-like multicopper oxidase with cupredoxin domain